MRDGAPKKKPSQKRVVKAFSVRREDLRRLDFVWLILSKQAEKGVRVTHSSILCDMLRREYDRCLKIAKDL